MLRVALLAFWLVTAAATNAAGLAFLASNKDAEGVVTLASGLQYKVLRKGDGDSHPTANSPCECHYEGRTAANYPSGRPRRFSRTVVGPKVLWPAARTGNGTP